MNMQVITQQHFNIVLDEQEQIELLWDKGERKGQR